MGIITRDSQRTLFAQRLDTYTFVRIFPRTMPENHPKPGRPTTFTPLLGRFVAIALYERALPRVMAERVCGARQIQRWAEEHYEFARLYLPVAALAYAELLEGELPRELRPIDRALRKALYAKPEDRERTLDELDAVDPEPYLEWDERRRRRYRGKRDD